MKASLLMFALLALAANAIGQSGQSQTPKTNNGQRAGTNTVISVTAVTSVASAEIKPRVSYSGVAVTAAKSKNPLQLINPWAPPEFFAGSDTKVTHDLLTGRPNAVRLFTINF